MIFEARHNALSLTVVALCTWVGHKLVKQKQRRGGKQLLSLKNCRRMMGSRRTADPSAGLARRPRGPLPRGRRRGRRGVVPLPVRARAPWGWGNNSIGKKVARHSHPPLPPITSRQQPTPRGDAASNAADSNSPVTRRGPKRRPPRAWFEFWVGTKIAGSPVRVAALEAGITPWRRRFPPPCGGNP